MKWKINRHVNNGILYSNMPENNWFINTEPTSSMVTLSGYPSNKRSGLFDVGRFSSPAEAMMAALIVENHRAALDIFAWDDAAIKSLGFIIASDEDERTHLFYSADDETSFTRVLTLDPPKVSNRINRLICSEIGKCRRDNQQANLETPVSLFAYEKWASTHFGNSIPALSPGTYAEADHRTRNEAARAVFHSSEFQNYVDLNISQYTNIAALDQLVDEHLDDILHTIKNPETLYSIVNLLNFATEEIQEPTHNP